MKLHLTLPILTIALAGQAVLADGIKLPGVSIDGDGIKVPGVEIDGDGIRAPGVTIDGDGISAPGVRVDGDEVSTPGVRIQSGDRVRIRESREPGRYDLARSAAINSKAWICAATIFQAIT